MDRNHMEKLKTWDGTVDDAHEKEGVLWLCRGICAFLLIMGLVLAVMYRDLGMFLVIGGQGVLTLALMHFLWKRREQKLGKKDA